MRSVLVFALFTVACGSKLGSDLFSEGEPGSGGTGGAGQSQAGSGAAGSNLSLGGTEIGAAGSGSGAMPGGGSSANGGQANQGDAGDSTIPSQAGADSGEAGSPPIVVDPPDPVCGNGKLEEGEECDDADHDGKDGCGAECMVRCSDFGEGTTESSDHHCYNGYDSAPYLEAQQDCMARGAHLVTIGSQAENAIANGFVNNSKFIGASEAVDIMSDAEGTYSWLTGEPFTFTNWAGGQPDREESRCNPNLNTPRCYEHCAAMQGDGKWMDQRCDMSDGYVCEWEPAGS